LKVRAGKNTKKYVGVFVTTGEPKAKKGNMNSGSAFYGSFLELGWKSGKKGSKNRRKIVGHAFMRPVFHSYKRAAAKAMTETIYQGINKELAKLNKA